MLLYTISTFVAWMEWIRQNLQNKDENIHKSEALKPDGRTKININTCRVSELND